MITSQEIDRVKDKAGKVKALAIGDAMLDRYIYGAVERISPEAPVPILSHQHTEVKAGGSANVALNLAAWGCATTLIGMTGVDPSSDILAGLLEQQGIRHHFFRSSKRPTTVKTRVVAASHHLLRIDEESDIDLNGDEETEAEKLITSYIQTELPDLIIIEDYNKGFLTPTLIDTIIREGKKAGAFIAVDPKDKHFFAYREVDLFKPNLREAGHAARRPLSLGDLEGLCSDWRKKMNITTIAITLGAQGIYLQDPSGGIHLPPEKSIDVVDVCGAGDAVICSLALGLLSGLKPASCGNLANMTGAYVCSHSGVVTVDVTNIYEWI